MTRSEPLFLQTFPVQNAPSRYLNKTGVDFLYENAGLKWQKEGGGRQKLWYHVLTNMVTPVTPIFVCR